ncbi:hypothetical protein ACHAQH_004491 [Verticillium albo-atrum]
MSTNGSQQGGLFKIPLEVTRMIIDNLSQSDTISLAQTSRAMMPTAIERLFLKDRNSGAQRALCLGCDLGLIVLVQKAVDYGYDLNKDTDGSVPLVRSVRRTHLGNKASVVKILLRHGADPSVGGSASLLTFFTNDGGAMPDGCHSTIPTLLLNGGATPSVIETNNIRLINAAIARADNTSCQNHGSACVIRVVQLLLKHGASPNRPLFTGDVSPLVRAMCSQQRPVDLVNLLLENGADPDAASELHVAPGRPYHAALDLPDQPRVPLKWAIFFLPVSMGWETKLQIVEALLARGGDSDRLWRSTIVHDIVEATASDVSSAVVPFGVACRLCALLVRSGANPNCLKDNEMPLQKVASVPDLNERDRMRLAGVLVKGGAWE